MVADLVECMNAIAEEGALYVLHDKRIYSTNDPLDLWSYVAFSGPRAGLWLTAGLSPHEIWDNTDNYLHSGQLITREQAASLLGCSVQDLE